MPTTNMLMLSARKAESIENSTSFHLFHQEFMNGESSFRHKKTASHRNGKQSFFYFLAKSMSDSPATSIPVSSFTTKKDLKTMAASAAPTSGAKMNTHN